MKISKFFYGFLITALLFASCNKDEELDSIQPESVKPTQNVSSKLKPIGSGVMMQAFYWDVPAGGTWWNTIRNKVDDWSNAGIDAIWFPFSMGYDPFDYYDFGEYNQMGSTETRFGSRSELESLISRAHRYDLSVIADIVTAAKYQITGFDPTTVELPHPKKFKTGEPIDNANPPEKQLIASEKYRDRPSPKALEVMLAAVTDLMKKHHPTDYPTDDVIIQSVIVGKGLSQTKMKQGLSNGRGHLGIKNLNNSKK